LISPTWNVVYGVEFSPDGTKLYGEMIVQARIYQFDLTQITASAILASAVLVGTCSNYIGALQLGPDNKIYVARDINSSLGYDSIGVINNPNLLGLACNFIPSGIYLGSGHSMMGLPNFMIKSMALSNVMIQSADVSCFNGTNGSATVSASGGNSPYTYLWSSGGSSATDSGLVAGTYTVQVTSADGCMATQTVIVTQPGAIQLTMTGTNETCFASDGTAGVNVSGGTPGYTYAWNNSGVNSNITNLPAGTYSVTVTDLNGCTSASSVVVININSLNADAGLTTTIVEGQSTILTGAGGVNYSWSPVESLSCSNCQNPVASPSVTTTYTVTVTNGQGCQGTDSVTVFVDINCGQLFIPNAFSPNGDNENDILYVRGKCIEQMKFAIFDRWGEEVFSCTDQSKGWDGSFNGQPCETSTFMYYLKATLNNGTEVNKSGTILLVK
jgi:gliding motility-associated-like protein